jgi:CHAD domain-containing protein
MAHMEIEDKYDVDESTQLPSLDGLPGVATVEAPVEHELEATYFDTPELTLARARITLRRRTGGHDEGWHLKLQHEGSRLEIGAPLGRSTRTPPKGLRDTVRGWTRDLPLAPVVSLSTRRTATRLLDAEGRLLAEVADDRVSATAHVPDGEAQQPPQGWREWEVELGEAGDAALLEAAAKLLRRAGATTSESASKLSRALGDRLPSPVVATVGRKSSAAEVVSARLREQLQALRDLDPLVRQDVEDSVHRMRVAVRRLRGALASYRPLLDRELTEPLRGELQWLAGSLGAARDAEVLHDELRSRLADEPAQLVRPEAARDLERQMRGRRQEARAAVLEALDSPRHRALVDGLEKASEAVPRGGRAGKRASTVLPARARREWKRAVKRLEAADGTEEVDARDVALHEARKAVKRARYAAEPLVALVGKDARRFVAAAEDLQAVLGDHHDSVVARAELRRLADGTPGDFTYGVLHAEEERRADELLARLPRCRKRFSSTARAWF